jgi:hypothetical protein
MNPIPNIACCSPTLSATLVPGCKLLAFKFMEISTPWSTYLLASLGPFLILQKDGKKGAFCILKVYPWWHVHCDLESTTI